MAKNLGETIEKNGHLFSMLVPLFAGFILLFLSISKLQVSVNADEAYSAYLTRGNFSDISNLSVNPPLYYFALKIWSLVFGTSDVAMRFMSVFFGFIAIVLIFQLIKKVFGVKAAVLSTIIVAASPLFVRYAQEMQSLMMALVIMVASIYCLTICLRNRKYWPVYILLVALGIWTHFSTISVFVAQLIIIVKYFKGFKKTEKQRILDLIILVLVPAMFAMLPFGNIYYIYNIYYSAVAAWVLFGVATVLVKKKILKILMSVVIVAATIFGVVINVNREPEGHIMEILSETFISAEEGQPIIISSADDYLAAIFYENDKYPIYAFSDILENAENRELIERYHINTIDDKEEFLAQNENVWYIMPKPGEGEEYNIPEWAKNLRITSEISLNYHAALRFTRGE